MFGSGATDMTGEYCRYIILDLFMAGAGNAQLEGIVVTDVEVAGATNVSLTMDGGELTGALAAPAESSIPAPSREKKSTSRDLVGWARHHRVPVALDSAFSHVSHHLRTIGHITP